MSIAVHYATGSSIGHFFHLCKLLVLNHNTYMENRYKIIIAGLFVGIGITCFFIGRISATRQSNTTVNKSEIVIISAPEIIEGNSSTPQEVIQLRASSRGSKYYFPWCPSTFSEENTVFFASEEEAQKEGYELAQNCLREKD